MFVYVCEALVLLIYKPSATIHSHTLRFLQTILVGVVLGGVSNIGS